MLKKIVVFISRFLAQLIVGFINFLINFTLDIISSVIAAIDVFGIFNDLFNREDKKEQNKSS